MTIVIVQGYFSHTGTSWGFLPGNSPDLNPVENVWSIMKEKFYCPPLATNKNMLVIKIEDVWDYVKLRGHTILPNLLEGDRGWKNRCRKVIENHGGEISKTFGS